MNREQGAERGSWPVAGVSNVTPAGSFGRDRSEEFTFQGRVNSSLRTEKWQQVLKIHGFSITVYGFQIHQRGEQQCLYWQIPNIKAR
jgi:hypothetical protein